MGAKLENANGHEPMSKSNNLSTRKVLADLLKDPIHSFCWGNVRLFPGDREVSGEKLTPTPTDLGRQGASSGKVAWVAWARWPPQGASDDAPLRERRLFRPPRRGVEA